MEVRNLIAVQGGRVGAKKASRESCLCNRKLMRCHSGSVLSNVSSQDMWLLLGCEARDKDELRSNFALRLRRSSLAESLDRDAGRTRAAKLPTSQALKIPSMELATFGSNRS